MVNDQSTIIFSFFVISAPKVAMAVLYFLMRIQVINVIQGSCTTDRNCPATEVCDNGQCRDPCSLKGACGLNAFCSVENHRKQCVCPQDFTGNPEVECVRIPSTCYSSLDCPGPLQCSDGICQPPCSTDEDCALNERCLQGLCMCKYCSRFKVFVVFCLVKSI